MKIIDGALLIAVLLSITTKGWATNPEAIEKLRFGMKEAEVEKILGKPSEKMNTAWLYGSKKNPKIRIEWKNGLNRAEALEGIPLINTQLPLQELSQKHKGDATATNKYFAHPESGRIWEVQITGKLMSFIVQEPWKAKKAGKKFVEIFKPIAISGGTKK